MDRSQIEDIFPLTPMQAGLLFQTLFDEGSLAYFLQMTLNWHGELDIDLFKESWRLLLIRHPVLRSAFIHEGVKQPLQVTFKQREPVIKQHNLSDLSSAEQEAMIADYQTADQAQGFDLQKDTLLRMGVFRLGAKKFRLVWSYHHILFDGWSFGILQHEFVTLYRLLSAGAPPSLPAVAPYRQYIHWLQSQSKAQSKENGVAYWRKVLAGYSHITSLPHLRPATDEFVFEQQTLEFDEPTTQRLNKLAAQCGATLNSLIRAIWAVLLGRYNNTNDVLFGAIVSGRPSALPGIEEMIGLFINAVPVRVQLDAELPFSELVRQIQQASLAGESHHYLPLADIQTLSSLGRDLFDHLLVFENYPMGANGENSAESGTDFVIEGIGMHDRTHYNFDITVAPGRQLTILFSYNQAIYPADQIERMMGHWQTVVRSILNQPETTLAEIEILPKAEQHQLSVEFNNSTRIYPTDVTILGLFAQQVAQKGTRTAVVFGEKRLTYRQLDMRVNQLARFLQKQGVTSDERVAICMERSLEMIVGVMGILRAGGAYVPIDPDYPPARITFMLEDAEPLVLLTQQSLVNQLPYHGQVVRIDTDWGEVAQETDGALACEISPETLAYIIYTSGSTGRPKGVMVTHGNLTNAAFSWREVYGLDQFAMRSLQMASLSFDVFAGDLVRSVTNGGELVICPADVRVDPAALYALLAEHRINIFESTPALVVPLMEYITENRHPIAFLKQLIIGSDSLPSAHYRSLAKRFGQDIRIFNSYGATEATVDSSLFESTSTSKEPISQNTPIGKPLPNVQFKVLTQNGKLAPIGIEGELVIMGAGVSKGYWKRPELTAERFQVGPVYYTGDQARWLPDGNVEFLGRLDDQVKLRGYRIESGEIEAQLLSFNGVDAAVVVIKQQQLIAYLHGDTLSDSTNDLRQSLRQQLPDYMVPNRFVWLDEIPLTPNGKVDRKSLRERDDTSQIDVVYIPPRSEIERRLADIWSEVLAVDKVGAHTNFFDLGGHSLKAMQVVSRIHQAFDVKVSLRHFFAEATVSELAQLVSGGEVDVYASIQPAAERAYYPLSYAQKRLWHQHQFDQAAAYNMPEAYLIEDELDVDALERTFRDIIERHEALRTAFVLIDGEPAQQILPSNQDFKISRFDLSGSFDSSFGASNLDARAQVIVDKDANQLFDLAQPPLLRATFIKLAERKHVFVLTIHHIIGDGWSGTVLYQEILALYEAYRHGRPNPLLPLRIQYKDFAMWQIERGFNKEEEYWLEKLAGLPDYLRLPTDFPIPQEREFRGSMVDTRLDTIVADQLRTLAQTKQTTLSNIILALFKLLLYQITKQADFCVGVAIANRNHPDLENLLGFFVNILPLRSQLSDEVDFDGLLAQVIEGMNGAFEHQDYPFDLIVEKLNPTRYANRPPIINVVYAFQSFGDVRVNMGGKQMDQPSENGDGDDTLSNLKVSFETSKFDLTLFVQAEEDGITLTLEYDTSLFKRPTIERYLGAMARFASMVAGTAGG
ncbi:MAG: amino acid adenylation domain-containing protein [Candidatus Promineifilaceae bacterium]|jgi:amino acid adenylation domain-containing protein